MDIWLSTTAMHSLFQQTFHDNELNALSEDGLWNDLDWHPEFRIETFPGSTSVEQQKARSLHLNDLIWANVDHHAITIHEPPTSNEPTGPRGSATLSHASYRSIERDNMTSGAPIKTILVVSASNRPNDAPIHVYIQQSWTVSELFEILLDECNIRGQEAETVSTIKATFLWNQRAQLLRIGKPDDWNIFGDALRRAWNEHGSYFVENTCEIEMILCVEEGA